MAKRCSHCHAYKAESEFNRDCRKRDGRRSQCRTCQRAIQQEYRKANLEAIRARGRIASHKWRDSNREKALASERRWRERKAQESKTLAS